MMREPAALLLTAFLVAFVLTRAYTRVARARGWGSGSVGGVHLHHIVVGIVLVLVSGLIEFASRPGGLGRDALAVSFGVGGAFVLDEFALSLYLRDVYWSEEGHGSIDASLMGVLLAGLLLVGLSPFGVHDGGRVPRLAAFALVAANIALALVTFSKGKLTLGLLAVFVPGAGVIGAARLASRARCGGVASTTTRSERVQSAGSTVPIPGCIGCTSVSTPSSAVRRPRR